ncbi:MAG: FAD-dependent oxidoreductase [Myxococcota bacterium]
MTILKTPDHAIVLGASMAGMMAAAALARHARQVTIVERDPLPDTISIRKGVPQGSQPHLLLDRGRQAIEGLLPGFFDEIHGHGARRVDFGRELRWYHNDRWKVSCDTGYTLSLQTRPFLEYHVRRALLRHHPNVTIRAQSEVVRPVVQHDRIEAVELHDRHKDTTELVPCELFVDASGRGARSRRWLAELDYGQAPEVGVRIGLGYSTRAFRRPTNAPSDWQCCVIYGRRPYQTCHGALFSVENDGWLFGFFGYNGQHPPADPEGLDTFARGLARPDLAELMRTAEPVSDIRRHTFPRQRWVHYHRLNRLPGGYAVVGDAVCSFDPIFGQGITIGAVEAELLTRALDSRRGFDSMRFARACARFITIPWLLTRIEAFRYPEVEGSRPMGLPLLHPILDRVFERSATDPEVYCAFLDIMQMNRSPLALMRPSVLMRLARSSRVTVDPERPLVM